MHISTKIYKATIGRDTTRPILQAVCLDRKNDCLVAADGFIMAIVPVRWDRPMEKETGPAGDLLIPGEAVEAAWKNGRGVLLGEKQAMAGYNPTTGGHNLYPYVEGNFPLYQQIIPQPGANLGTVNARKLRTFGNKIGDTRRGHRITHFYQIDDRSAVRVYDTYSEKWAALVWADSLEPVPGQPDPGECLTALDPKRLLQLAEAICEKGSDVRIMHNKTGNVSGSVLVKPVKEDNGAYGVIMPMHIKGG